MFSNKLAKRFISFNGHSYVQKGSNFIRIGNDKDKENYYSIIQEYKALEHNNTVLVRNHHKIIINPLVDRGVAKEICSLRGYIQNLQYAAMGHYLEIDGQIYKISSSVDRAAQIRHEHIIHLYRAFLRLPKEEFVYFKLKI
jgi:hypothetical protein